MLIWYLYGSPESPKAGAYSYTYTPGGAYDFWINKNCKTPDRAIDLFDYFYTFEGSELIIDGIQGKHWDTVDGEPQIKESILNSESTDPEYRIKSGILKYNPMAGFSGTAKDDKGFAVNFRSNIKIKEKTLTAFEKSYCKDVGELVPGESFLKKISSMDLTIQASITVGDDNALNDIAGKINEYITLNYVKLLNPKSDAEWYAAYGVFLDGVNALGNQKLMDGLNTRIQKMAKALK